MWPECREPGERAAGSSEQFRDRDRAWWGHTLTGRKCLGPGSSPYCLPAFCKDSGNPQECPCGTWAEGWGYLEPGV